MQEQTSSNSLGERVPKLRFPGFEGGWEEHKISDFLSESKIIGHNGREAKKLTIKLWAKGVVEKKTIFDGSIQTQYYIRKSGQLVYGKLDFLNSAFGIVPPELDGYETTSDAPAFDILNVNSQFLLNRIIQPSFYKKNGEKANGSRKAKRIHPDTFLAMPIFVPPILEQEKIATFIILLDKKIELQKKLIESLKLYKRGLLSKLFPQKGESVPQYRFTGFTDAWEQRKVTELGDIYIGLVTTMTAHYTDHGTLLIRNSDIKDGKFEFDTEQIYLDGEFAEANKSRMHRVGDVITVHTGDVGTSAVITENEANSIGFATIVTRPNKEILDSYYLSVFLNTDKHKNWAVQMSTGDGRTNYNLREYTELIVPVPAVDEQKKIAKCIMTLNNLITLHQQKYSKMQSIKKFMLQNMFV